MKSIIFFLLSRISKRIATIGIYRCRLQLELLGVRRMLLDPVFLAERRFADMVHADRVIDILHVTPAIWSAIFQPKKHEQLIRKRLMAVFASYRPEQHYMRGPGPK